MSNSGVLVCESDTDFEKIVEIYKKKSTTNILNMIKS